tara:strand:- start:16334 stop:16819 length:486 start_codon:yes stop_codon:yes gene_type:complete
MQSQALASDITPTNERVTNMAISTDKLVNTQYTWSIATDDVPTFNQVQFLNSMDMPNLPKTVVDVTPTDATSTVNAVANFRETSEIAFTLYYMPTDPQHMELKAAFNNNTTLKNKITFIDAAGEGFIFDGMIKEFNLVAEQKDMLKVEGVLVISSEVTPTV